MSRAKTLRKFIIFITGFFLFAFLVSGTTFITMKYPGLAADKIGQSNVDLINGFSETLYNLLRITKSNYYQVGNEYSTDGVNHIQGTIPTGLKLLVNYHVSRHKGIIELIDIDSGETLKTWQPNGKNISKQVFEMGGKIKKGEELFYNHPIMLADSSIIANTLGFAIFKIDAQSNLVWVKTIKAHHSLEMDHEGYLWGSGMRSIESFPSKTLHFNTEIKLRDDTIFKLNPANGEVVYRKSVIDILTENGLEDLIYANGHIELDPIHLNDVQPALSDGEYWKTGDLLLSSKHLSAIFLYRPSSNKILWHQVGPWLNQHDPDFFEDDKIVIFGNQNLRGEDSRNIDYSRIFNNVFLHDFSTEETSAPYEQLLTQEKIKTYTQGRSEILSNGDIFIEETDNGRIIIGDSTKKKMEFVRRADEKNIYILHWSRIMGNETLPKSQN